LFSRGSDLVLTGRLPGWTDNVLGNNVLQGAALLDTQLSVYYNRNAVTERGTKVSESDITCIYTVQ